MHARVRMADRLGGPIGQGREAARRFLVENPDLRERIAEAVYAAKGIKRAVPARGGPEAAEAAAERE
jgi:hypothetical protein